VKLFASAVACLLLALPGVTQTVVGSTPASSSLPIVGLTASQGPRGIEDLTRRKILHDYAAAWQSLDAGLEQNHAELVNDYFTGFAKDEFTRTITEQSATGIHRHYVDHGHKLEVLFYSPDGGVMQLQDNAEYDVQIFDGARLLHSETVTARYLVLMTPAADRWMVRLLQDVPAS
jgi:hypothetical protein